MTAAATIFALASAPGRGGVAVIRISGSSAGRTFDLCSPKGMPAQRLAALKDIRHPKTGEFIDRALALWFPAPHSFTGEDVAELHIHGGRAILNAVTECLQSLGFRLAEPGEFTRRAFENGKLDLTEAEAIADLVNAETEAQRRQALRQFEGELGRLYEDWRARLTKALAYLEATIDFSDEDLPPNISAGPLADVASLSAEIDRHLADRHRGERLREGFSIAILGAPNAGKSSLLNALAKREAAIVSSIAGTTRDIIEIHLDLGGYPVILADTAGLRESKDEIESEGIRRALARAEKSDLKLIVFDGEKWPQRDPITQKHSDENAIAVVNKADLINGSEKQTGNEIFVSARTGAGIQQLLEKITFLVEANFSIAGPPPLTRARHRVSLEECRDNLRRALTAREIELRTEDIRMASRALGRITGRVDVEDLLDVIFRDFCIGK